MNSKWCSRGAVWACAWILCGTVMAQAWIPEKKKGSLGVGYQYTTVDEHLFSGDTGFGDSLDLGQIDGQSMSLGADYGLANRWGLSGSFAYVSSRYQQGGFGEPENPVIDDGDWHGSLQDAFIQGRYALRPKSRTAITPAVAVVIPMSDYDIIGHAAPGRNLMELQAGVNVGHVFGRRRPTSYLQGNYTYAFVESVGEFDIDRSNVSAEWGYYVTERFNINVTASYQKTHGGIDWLEDLGEGATEDDFHTHDQAAKANFFRSGIGVWFPVGSKGGSLFVAAVATLWGENTHDATAFSTGFTWNFLPGFKSTTLPEKSARRKEKAAERVVAVALN